MREKSKAIFDLPQRLEQKWDEMNIKRLMKVLMAMKMVDPQLLAQWTKPEKDRQKYNEKKRQAIAASFRRINDEIAELRTRLLPIEKSDEDRMIYVRDNLKSIFVSRLDDNTFYESIAEAASIYVQIFKTIFVIVYKCYLIFAEK